MLAFSNTHSYPTAVIEETADPEDVLQKDYIAMDGNGPAEGRVIN
jgi:hypothetical protein